MDVNFKIIPNKNIKDYKIFQANAKIELIRLKSI